MEERDAISFQVKFWATYRSLVKNQLTLFLLENNVARWDGMFECGTM
jgi:hypothetical protein